METAQELCFIKFQLEKEKAPDQEKPHTTPFHSSSSLCISGDWSLDFLQYFLFLEQWPLLLYWIGEGWISLELPVYAILKYSKVGSSLKSSRCYQTAVKPPPLYYRLRFASHAKNCTGTIPFNRVYLTVLYTVDKNSLLLLFHLKKLELTLYTFPKLLPIQTTELW